MTNTERDELIAEKLNSGMSLSDVQKLLENEYGIKMTYLDLRMLSCTLKVQWEKKEKHAKVVDDITAAPAQERPAFRNQPPEDGEAGEAVEEDAVEDAGEDAVEEQAAAPEVGLTDVTIDDEPIPGATISGTVRFLSGASGKWFMDRMGRLGISELDEGSAEPTPEDVQAFQAELQGMMRARSEELQRKAFDGKTKVDVSPIVRSGCEMNGSVTFASGARGEWFLAGGKLDFDIAEDSGKPTRDDLTYFQLVLSKVLREKGYGY